MEQLHASAYILLGLLFLFAYAANLSTKHARRLPFAIGYLVTVFVFVGTTAMQRLSTDSLRAWIIPYNFSREWWSVKKLTAPLFF
jgi:hypothetical protein